ncbi:MAG: agmatine deiminase family protein [Verrucomicrobia bacterium]|nr:agmatine deiminase family protein [Verrucomicrobiota bacterium]
MPAEWEPHAATWLSWPRASGISFPGCYDTIPPVLAKMVAALAESEPVHINVQDADEEETVRGQLRQNGVADLAHVRFFHIPTNEPWCRDHGPVFLTQPGVDFPLVVVDWEYNAWGWKYPPFDLDDAVPTRVAAALGGLPVFYPGIVLEGGSIDVNGSGTVLTTESCLLNVNRNPNLKRAQLEAYLRGYLGVTNILWLGDGIEGDDTDGHIDDLTRFVNRTTVVTVVEEDAHDTNHEPLQHNLQLLRQMSVEDGTPLRVLTLPMPAPVRREGQRLPASYANFYVANKVVLLPAFNDPADAWAASVLREAFPKRKIVPINCRDLIWGLGAFHCLTQQMPVV